MTAKVSLKICSTATGKTIIERTAVVVDDTTGAPISAAREAKLLDGTQYQGEALCGCECCTPNAIVDQRCESGSVVSTFLDGSKMAFGSVRRCKRGFLGAGGFADVDDTVAIGDVLASGTLGPFTIPLHGGGVTMNAYVGLVLRESVTSGRVGGQWQFSFDGGTTWTGMQQGGTQYFAQAEDLDDPHGHEIHQAGFYCTSDDDNPDFFDPGDVVNLDWQYVITQVQGDPTGLDVGFLRGDVMAECDEMSCVAFG